MANPWDQYQQESGPWAKYSGEPASDADAPVAQPVAPTKARSGGIMPTLRTAAQGLTFGFADELEAGIGALPAIASRDKSVADEYRRIHSNLAQERQAYRQDSPVASMGVEMAGAIPTGIAGGARMLGSQAVQGLTRVPQWLRTAGVGATEGAIYGAGAADPGERASGAALGGAVGAFTAPVASAAVGTVANVLSPIARSFREHLSYTPQTQAVEVLRRVADDAGLTVDDIVDQYRKLGDDSMLVDADENFRGLMRALADRSGTAKREARQVIESRQLGSVDRLIETMEKTTGKKAAEFADTIKSIKAERHANSSPLYDEAWSAQPSSEMLAIAESRPSVKAALKRGERLAADEGEDIAGSAFKQFHYAKMALDDQIGKSLRAGNNNHARILINAKNELLGAMDTASPAYRQARDLYAGDSELLNAAAKGQDLFKMRPDEVDGMVSAFGSSEREMFKQGAVKAIVDRLEDSQLTHDNARKLINSKTMQRKMEKLFDSPDELRAFITQAIREREFGRTRQVVAGGSPTSQNLQMQKQLDDYAAQAFSFLDGAKGGIVSSVMNALKGKPITPETINEASRILLDNGLTEAQIREIFTRSRIIDAAQDAAPAIGNAMRGLPAPMSGALMHDH